MKKYISIILVLAMLVSPLCGCSLFSDSAENSVLSIPKKGQEYYKRVVYQPYNGSFNAEFLHNYLSISDYIYDDNLSKAKNKFVIFDDDAKIIYDGADEKQDTAHIFDDKKVTYGSDDKIYVADINGGDKEEFFNGYIPRDYKDGNWVVTNYNGKYGIIDDKGNEIIPCKYDSITNFDKKGYALIEDRTQEKFGMIDKDNNLVIPINYAFLVPFNAVINSGEFEGEYNDLYIQSETTYDYTFAIDSNENAYTIDREGNKVFDISDSEYKPASSGNGTLTQNLISVEKDDLCGYIDMQGNEVIPLKYNDILWDFVNGYSCVSVGSNYGIINAKGEEILPFEYTSITPFDQKGLAIAKISSDDETLVIDLAGNVAYKTSNSLEAIGGGYFRESIPDSKVQVIQITTEKGDYKTYTPKEFTID